MPGDKGITGTKAWTPAIPAKRPDNIISSDYARTSKIFTPSYERECRPCMNQLIANEYQRIWWEERDAWASNHPDKSKVKKLLPKPELPSRKVRYLTTVIIPKSSKKKLPNKGKAQ